MTKRELVEVLESYPDDMPVKIQSDGQTLDVQAVNSQSEESKEFILIW